jgi:hypothetical protein
MRWCLLGLLVACGCSKVGGGPAKSDPKFDQAWLDLAKQGSEPLFIETDQSGSGLLGEVRRAVEPGPDAALGRGAAPLMGMLPDNVAAGVVRQNLGAVKACYQIEQRAGTVGSGKAIVTIQIDPAGTVKDVKVDAPAFESSRLPACLSGRARSWTFPKFSAPTAKTFSYPLVFVNG